LYFNFYIVTVFVAQWEIQEHVGPRNSNTCGFIGPRISNAWKLLSSTELI